MPSAVPRASGRLGALLHRLFPRFVALGVEGLELGRFKKVQALGLGSLGFGVWVFRVSGSGLRRS